MNEDLLKRQLAVIMARFSEFEKRSEKQLSNHEKRLNDLEKTNKDVKIVSLPFVNNELNKVNGGVNSLFKELHISLKRRRILHLTSSLR
jgi:phage terminase Nu1 subunit (DNA packaging protein)